MIRCPIHNQHDCSPLLNGCSLVNKLTQAETDAKALDFITSALSGTEWDADTLDVVAEVVRGTGRKVVEL